MNLVTNARESGEVAATWIARAHSSRVSLVNEAGVSKRGLSGRERTWNRVASKCYEQWYEFLGQMSMVAAVRAGARQFAIIRRYRAQRLAGSNGGGTHRQRGTSGWRRHRLKNEWRSWNPRSRN